MGDAMKFPHRRFRPGLIPTPQQLRVGIGEPDPAWFKPRAGAPDRDDWFSEITPTPEQHGGSCAFWSACQAYMAMIRRELGDVIPTGYILSGDQFHRQYIDREFGDGDYDRGAYLDSGIKELAKSGVFGSARYGIARIPFNANYMRRLIRVTPLLFGFALTPGWSRPDNKTGQIPIGGIPNPKMGHATCGVDMQTWPKGRATLDYTIGINTWGTSWGRYGYWAMTVAQAEQQSIADVMGLYLPDGVGDAWEKYLVKVA